MAQLCTVNGSLHVFSYFPDALISPLGMESGDIRPTQISVRLPGLDSSPAMRSRLFTHDTYFYDPSFHDKHLYGLIVYLREIYMLSGLVLQGCGWGDNWVTVMNVSVALGPFDSDWAYVKDVDGTILVSLPLCIRGIVRSSDDSLSIESAIDLCDQLVWHMGEDGNLVSWPCMAKE